MHDIKPIEIPNPELEEIRAHLRDADKHRHAFQVQALKVLGRDYTDESPKMDREFEVIYEGSKPVGLYVSPPGVCVPIS
jgi:hypothetical protein